MILYQDCSIHRNSSKNMAAGGGGVGCLFFLYIYVENLKTLLVRNHWTGFNITWQECFFCTLYQDCSSRHDSSKNMTARGWGLFFLYIYTDNLKNFLVRGKCLFSLYIYIANFKNHLVRNHWTDFNIIWQK